MPREIQGSSDFHNVISDAKKAGKLAVVDCYATWCGPCKAIAPFYEQLAGIYPDVEFLKICEGGDNSELLVELGVQAFPTFLFYVDGQKKKEIKGADPNALRSTIDELKSTMFSAFSGSGQSLGGTSASISPEQARQARLARLGGNTANATSASSSAPKTGTNNNDVPKQPLNEGLVQDLIEMSFSRHQAEMAVRATNGTGLEAAMDWLGEHQNDEVSSGTAEGSASAADQPSTEEKQPISKEEKVKLAEERIRKLRQEKEEEEKRQQREREIKRRTEGQQIGETREQLEALQRKRALDEQRKQQDFDKQERLRLRRELAKDKLDRLEDKYGGIEKIPNELKNPLLDQIHGVKKNKLSDLPPGERMDKAVGLLSQYRATGDGLRALKILSTLVRNALEKQNDPKYEKVNLENDTIRKRIVSLTGGISFLTACGFARPEPDASGKRENALYLDRSYGKDTVLQSALDKLDAAIASMS